MTRPSRSEKDIRWAWELMVGTNDAIKKAQQYRLMCYAGFLNRDATKKTYEKNMEYLIESLRAVTDAIDDINSWGKKVKVK